ncbi:MAG TPA: PAS domain-containing sensor histidine kinase [Burkholderiales bacterium]|nr:PAS domain-containing sensor histidine kinase [Burkholderiales bacterium]
MEDSTIRPLLEQWLMQTQDHAVILLDPSGLVVEWYPAATRLLGYAREEALGKPLDMIFVPEDREKGVPAYEREVARRTGRSEDDRWHVSKNGSRLWVEGILTAVFDAQGEHMGYGKVMRDRTDIRAHIDSIDNRNLILTHTEEQRRLFIATLAHELRNFMGPLSNAADLAYIQLGRPSPCYPVDLIRRQVRAMGELVDDLLQLTLSREGKQQVNYSLVDLGSTVQHAVETCSADLAAKSLTTQILIPAPIEIEADALKLQQVLVNLIGNAAKFSPPNSVIEVRCSTEGAEAVIRILDEGAGIAPELMPRIFDAFVQGDHADNAHNALGLGLALVRRFVELHNGTVQVRSDGRGLGSEFIVRMPLRRRPGAPMPA